MAIMIPSSLPKKASKGEERLYNILKNKLTDNFYAWYEPRIDGRYPDFIILSPMSNLTNEQANRHNLIDILPIKNVIYRDELLAWDKDNIPESTIIQRFKKMFGVDFAFSPLTPDQISTIKGIIYPEKAVRQNEGWQIKANLQQLEANITQAFTTQKLTLIKHDNNINKLVEICQKSWKDILYHDIPRYVGTINSLPSDKAHGWIIDDEGNYIFFLQKELPPFLRKEKQRVSFILKESYDKKRNQKSVRAVNFQIQKE